MLALWVGILIHGRHFASGDTVGRMASYTVSADSLSLQDCIDKLLEEYAGQGECHVQAGRYEDLDVISIPRHAKVKAFNITITGPEGTDEHGAPLALLDGSTQLAADLKWSQDATFANGCVWQSEALRDGSGNALAAPTQLWMSSPGWNDAIGTDMQPLTVARWPNGAFHDGSIWHGSGKNGSFAYSSKASRPGEMVDDGQHEPSLAASGIDFTGKIAVIPFGTMGIEMQAVKVVRHGTGQSSFSFSLPPGTRGKGHLNIAYFFEGDCDLLDSEGEWCVPQGSGNDPTVRVWLPGCASPTQKTFRVKLPGREYFLNATARGTLALRNLGVFGQTLAMSLVDLRISSVSWLFPTASARVLGDIAKPVPTSLNINRAGGSIEMVNSTYAFADAVTPFPLVGKDALFENNLWYGNCYASGSSASVGDGGGRSSTGLRFIRNTVQNFNSFVGITPGLHATVELNRFSGQGIAADGACVHVHILPQNGVMIRRNWAHDTVVKSIRFDRVNSALATWGMNGTCTGNVAWRTDAAFIKGDHHTVTSNTMFAARTAAGVPALQDAFLDRPQPDVYNLAVMEFDPTKSWSKPGENNHTIFKDNAADSLFNVSGQLAGIHSNNLAGPFLETQQTGGIAAQLCDPATLDFRPRPGSQLEKSGAGAYTTSSGEYWIPGKQLSTASSPVPPHGAVNVDAGCSQLAWLGAHKATSHAVRFGRSPNKLERLETAVMGLASGAATPILQPGTTYFWQLSVVRGSGREERHGPLWSFTTAPSSFVANTLIV